MSALNDVSEHSNSELYGSYAYTDTLKGIRYGPGCVKTALPALLYVVGASKALIITGRSLHTKTDVVRRVEAVLGPAHGATFWEIGEHAPVAGVRAGVKALEDAGADVLVSVGGGSPIDAAKAIAYYHKQNSEKGRWLPHIAIPTTLSAAEYTLGAGYTDDDGHKVAVAAPEIGLAGIILDAELTLATPERLWLSTGMRAVDHAVENLYRPLIPHPLKVLCHAALADLFTYLRKSKADPTDVVVRQKLQIASWMSLWPITLGKYSALGISHALGHKLGARYHIPHGITSCLTLSPVVALQAQIASNEDKQYLANALFYLRIPSSGSVDGDVLVLSKAIDQLVVDLGLKTDLAAYNVPTGDLPDIAGKALGGPDHPNFEQVVKVLESIHPGSE